MLSKVTKWLRTHGPDILEIIRNLSQVLAETVGKQSMATSLVPTIPDVGRQSRPKDYKQVVFLLLDQLSKHVKNEILIIIEDSHALSNYDKEFLANLLANHPRNVHVLISRRQQEEDGSLLSSPEVRYLMKQDRLIKIHGLNKDAAGLLLEKRNVDYDHKSLGSINDFLNGNPYFLNLLASIAVESRFSLRGGEFRKLLKLDFQKLGEYLHSQVYMNLTEFESVLRASSILPSNIHAELLSYMLNNHKLQEIHDQILELERRGILCKDEVGGYRFFHTIFQSYIRDRLLSGIRRVQLHKATASYYRKLGEVAPTPLSLTASLYHSERADDYETQYWALYQFAGVYQTLQMFTESKQHGETALQVAIEHKDEEKEFEALLLLLGLIPYLKLDDPEKKISRLKHLVKSEKLSTKENQVRVLFAEAIYKTAVGKPIIAIKIFEECIRFAEQTGEERNFLHIMLNEAILLRDLWKIKEARKKLRICLRGYERLGDSQGIMLSLLAMGNLECLSNPKKATELYQRALNIAEKYKNYGVIATALHGMGIISFDTNDFPKAESYFKKSISITRKTGDTIGLTSTYNELARVMIATGRLKQASKIIKKTRKICKDLGHLEGLGHINLLMGDILEIRRKWDNAKRRFLNAHRLFTELGDSRHAEYAQLRYANVGSWYANEWIRNIYKGEYQAKIGSDGFTDAERRLNPFVEKKVRVTVNQGRWKNLPISGFQLVYEGILHKEKRVGRLTKLDLLMGHGRFDWWIEGNVVKGAEPFTGNFLIAPFFVESIEKID